MFREYQVEYSNRVLCKRETVIDFIVFDMYIKHNPAVPKIRIDPRDIY